MGDPTNAFTAEYGTKQGRILSSSAAHGAYLLQLGQADVGVRRLVASGDVHKIASTFDMAGMRRINATLLQRTADLPSGWQWIFRIVVANAYTWLEWPLDASFTNVDIGILVNGIALAESTTTLDLSFELEIDGIVSETIEVELPGISLDALIAVPSGLFLDCTSRNPAPGQTSVPVGQPIRFTVGASDVPFLVDELDATVLVNGLPVYQSGVFAAGWSGSAVQVVPGYTVAIRFELLHDAPFESLGEYTVRINAGGGDDFVEWSFTTEDTIAPIVESAFAPTPTTVRVVFDEPMDETTVLDPAYYTLLVLSGAPAVTPAVISVEFEAPRTVVLTLATMMTRGALYRVAVTNVKDVAGNQITKPKNTAQFVGYRWPVPAGRRTQLFEYLPAAMRAKDVTGEHERFIGVMQELFDVYYGLADRALDIIDPDFAPIEAVDNMLIDLGNPFDFLELTETEKRILVQTLLAIYKTKGTGPGIVNALRFFLGIEVSIRVYAWAPYGIGEAIIGETFVLGSSDQTDLYTFEVVVRDFLTDTERKNLTAIVEYMKVAHEHWRLIEPQVPEVFDHWQLGFSHLGTETILHSP